MDASNSVNATRRSTVSWAIRLSLWMPAAVTLAADPIVVSVTDSKPTGAIVRVHDDLPVDSPEPAAQSPMPSDVRQAVYWPDPPEPTAPREGLVNRTNDLMRRALRPLSPLNPWGNSASERADGTSGRAATSGMAERPAKRAARGGRTVFGTGPCRFHFGLRSRVPLTGRSAGSSSFDLPVASAIRRGCPSLQRDDHRVARSLPPRC
jgi:hypothetical protein